MKDSGLPWIGNMPEDWHIASNKFILKKEKNIIDRYNGETILSLTMKGVIKRNLDAGGKMPSSFVGYQRVKKDRLLLCLFDIDVTPRCVGIINEDGITSPAYSQYIVEQSNCLKYYYYYFLMLDNDKTLVHLTKSLRNTINANEFGNLKTIVPPKEEQQQIADYLDKKCSKIDKLSQQITDEIEDLKAYENSLITKAVTKGLNTNVPMKASGIEWIGKIPENWKFEKLKYLSSCNDETLDDSTRKDYEFDYVDISSVTFGKGISKYEKMTFETSPSRARRIVKAGDVIISTVRTYLKAIAYIQKHDLPIVVSTGFAVLRPNSKVNKRFFMYATQANTFISRIEADSYGVSYPAINADKLVNCGILVPPKKEQAEVAKYLDEKCAEINKLILQKTRQSKLIREYKSSLIYDYVTGKKQVPTN